MCLCWRACFLVKSRVLFTRPASMEKCKSNFKTGSHSTIHTFKNYFATMFSVFSFQFSAINDIQTDLNYQFFFSFYFVEKMLIVICGLLGCQKNMDNKCWFILYSISFSKKNVFFFSYLPTLWSNSLLRFYLKF